MGKYRIMLTKAIGKGVETQPYFINKIWSAKGSYKDGMLYFKFRSDDFNFKRKKKQITFSGKEIAYAVSLHTNYFPYEKQSVKIESINNFYGKMVVLRESIRHFIAFSSDFYHKKVQEEFRRKYKLNLLESGSADVKLILQKNSLSLHISDCSNYINFFLVNSDAPEKERKDNDEIIRFLTDVEKALTVFLSKIETVAIGYDGFFDKIKQKISNPENYMKEWKI